MKLSFRWYGQDDPVTLGYIRQIPNMRSIVTAVYDVPVGEVWSRESIAALKTEVEANGLIFDVVESVPVHEDIKLGRPTRDRLIANYQENIRRLGCRCSTGPGPSWTSRWPMAPPPWYTIRISWKRWIP